MGAQAEAAGAGAHVGVPAMVRLDGRLDAASVGQVRELIALAVATGEGDLFLDCSRVEWVDVTGLGLLTSTHRRLRRADRRLVLVGCRPQLRRALAVTRLSRVLPTQSLPVD